MPRKNRVTSGNRDVKNTTGADRADDPAERCCDGSRGIHQERPSGRNSALHNELPGCDVESWENDDITFKQLANGAKATFKRDQKPVGHLMIMSPTVSATYRYELTEDGVNPIGLQLLMVQEGAVVTWTVLGSVE